MIREYSIKKSLEIDAIIHERKSVGNKQFVVYTKKNNETSHFRYAISIGKKYGNAVERNLMKRRIRSVITLNQDLLLHLDYIIVVRKDSKDCSFQEIEGSIKNLLRKVHQWKKELF